MGVVGVLRNASGERKIVCRRIAGESEGRVMPRGKKVGQVARHAPPHAEPLAAGDAAERGGMGVADEREHESAYTSDDGRHFRVLYNPDVHDPRWFVRSFVVGPDGAPVDIRDYPERYSDEAAREGTRRATDAAPHSRSRRSTRW